MSSSVRGGSGSVKQQSDQNLRQGSNGSIQDSISLSSPRKGTPVSMAIDARQILEINGSRLSNVAKPRSLQGIGNQNSRSESPRFMSDNISSAHNNIMHDLVADKLYRGRTETIPRNEDDIRAISMRLEAFLDQMIRERPASLKARGNSNSNKVNNNNFSNNSSNNFNNSAKVRHADSHSSHNPNNNDTRSPINVLLSRISQRIAPAEQLQELIPGGNTQELVPGGNTQELVPGGNTADSRGLPPPRRRSIQRRPSLDVRPLTIRQISRPFLFGLSLKSRDDLKSDRDSKEKDEDDVKLEPKQVIMYNAWLDFASPDWRSEEKRMEYLSFKRSDTNIILKIVVFVLLIIFGGTMVLVHYTVHTNSSVQVQATFIISLVFALIAIISAIFTICTHFLLLSTWYVLIRASYPCHTYFLSFLRTISSFFLFYFYYSSLTYIGTI